MKPGEEIDEQIFRLEFSEDYENDDRDQHDDPVRYQRPDDLSGYIRLFDAVFADVRLVKAESRTEHEYRQAYDGRKSGNEFDPVKR